jgi:exonuclease SbcC
MEEAREKYDMLEQGEKTCPLCKQPLGAEGQAHLRDEYEAQGRERRRQYDENTAEIKTLTASHKEMTVQLAQLEARLTQGRQQVERTAATLERDRANSQKATTELKSASAELTGIEEQLQSEKFAVEERGQIAVLDSELAALGYDAARHNQVRQRSKELERFDELHRKLQEAVKELPVARESLETAQQMLQRRKAEAAESQERKAALERELEGLPSAESRLKEAQARFQDLDRQRQEALVRQGVLQNAIERCEQAEGELRRSEKRHAGLVDDKSVYDELAVAFGKNGIQALIIETAIPQLEADANELLGRLTENRMHLRLQLQEGRKDSRTGMPSEELDIKIADEVGTRSYETFSGGEAFRINFALRIALSKLLAQRSGAPLPILFIDEGFGSQDAAGQERLTQAIQSIQDDFQKIIVITHIEQIKEAFPVRIEVTKTGSGSTFTVA